MLFCSRTLGLGELHLYICYKENYILLVNERSRLIEPDLTFMFAEYQTSVEQQMDRTFD